MRKRLGQSKVYGVDPCHRVELPFFAHGKLQCRHTHRHTHTYVFTHTRARMHAHTTQTRTYTNTTRTHLRHTHTHTHTHAHARYTHTYTNTHTRTHTATHKACFSTLCFPISDHFLIQQLDMYPSISSPDKYMCGMYKKLVQAYLQC